MTPAPSPTRTSAPRSTKTKVFLCAAVIAGSTLTACRGRVPETSDAPARAAGRFPHSLHSKLNCIECHAESAVLDGIAAQPGAADHAPCDRGNCHREQFMAKPGPLCAICHPKVSAAVPGATTVLYPPTRGPRALASRFSHEQHLDYGAMENRVGFHVSCTDCHASANADTLTRPGHIVCSRCHAPAARPAGAPSMRECTSCHQTRSIQPVRTRRVIRDDLHFEHKNHRRDRNGVLIRCTSCHDDAPAVQRTGTHIPPPTRRCVTCHDDSARVPPAMRMQRCETCHATLAMSLAQLPPRSHLPEPARPEDHTLAFRVDHAVEAEAGAAECARCHTDMSGSNRDACDDCHQSMRPVDHVVTFREYEHGTVARARVERCATCHQGDFCVACHSRPPHSHFPLGEFRMGHGSLARFEARACMTCHQPDRDCTGSGCHTVRPRQ